MLTKSIGAPWISIAGFRHGARLFALLPGRICGLEVLQSRTRVVWEGPRLLRLKARESRCDEGWVVHLAAAAAVAAVVVGFERGLVPFQFLLKKVALLMDVEAGRTADTAR